MATPVTRQDDSAVDAASSNVLQTALTDVTLYFQRYPGVEGTDEERGIPAIPYRWQVEGLEGVREGTTGPAGDVVLSTVPIGAVVLLSVFESTYRVEIRGPMEAHVAPSTASLAAVRQAVLPLQRRLQALGYELSDVDGDAGPKTDRALLMFQADSGISPKGLVCAVFDPTSFMNHPPMTLKAKQGEAHRAALAAAARKAQELIGASDGD